MEKEMQRPKRINALSSIKSKIIATIIGAVLITILICMYTVVPISKNSLSDSTKSYMLSMASSESTIIDYVIGDTEGTAQQYADILSDVKVDNVDSSYAYLVNADGIMMYHKTSDKIGSVVENEVVKELVTQLQAGNTPADNVISYEYNGVMKYASYAVTKNNNILVITADEEEVMKPINNVVKTAIFISIAVVILLAMFGFMVGTVIVRPIERITDIIGDTAEFNFKHNPYSDSICKRKDETGEMARAVRSMRESLRDMVQGIENAKGSIASSVSKLQLVIQVVNQMSSDNSATTQELAAGMQETSATTETIFSNIGDINKGATSIKQLSVDGARQSMEVMKRANSLKNTTLVAATRTKEIYNSVKAKSDQAIVDAKAVEKINVLTEAIMSISSQTGLLALNASIEAARAGEAGKGFAVVASEIGKLADQTSKEVTNINQVVDEVNQAVQNMSDCLEETSGFLGSTVLDDYQEFTKVGEQYNEDANVFKTSMNDVQSAIEVLNDSLSSIAEALSGINETIGESTVGITDIAQKTAEMVEKASETDELATESFLRITELEKIVNQFKLS